MKKNIIITGGNSGLGLETAKSLINKDKDINIIIASRNLIASNKVVEDIKLKLNTNNIIAMELDLSSFKSIRDFEKSISKIDNFKISSLICNSGLQITSETQTTKENIEMTFGVNHLGHFLLTKLLYKYLEEKSRIILVSSGTHYNPSKFLSKIFGIPSPKYIGAKELANPNNFSSFSTKKKGFIRYSTSKLCNILFGYQLNKKLIQKGKNITVNLFDPGLMPGTNLARTSSKVEFWVWKNLLPLLEILDGVYNVKTSAQNLANLATSVKMSNISGKYFEGSKEYPSSKESYDENLMSDLWKVSEDLIGEVFEI
jgi:NAD(P)-dependent dehydrogenase (short-subunit alcohol dehydrogenase family)